MVRRMLATTCFLWLMLGGVAAAQNYATSDIPLEVDSGTLEAGDVLNLNAEGFEPDSAVDVVLIEGDGSEQILAELTADDAGAISGEVTIPDDFSGDGALVARGTASDGGTQVLGVAVEKGQVQDLARTGAGETTQWLFGLGVASIAAGSLMVLSYRSRLRKA